MKRTLWVVLVAVLVVSVLLGIRISPALEEAGIINIVEDPCLIGVGKDYTIEVMGEPVRGSFSSETPFTIAGKGGDGRTVRIEGPIYSSEKSGERYNINTTLGIWTWQIKGATDVRGNFFGNCGVIVTGSGANWLRQ